MNITIRFEAIYLKKAFWWLFSIGFVISIFIFLGFKIDLSYRYSLSVFIVFLGIIVVFYLNRNELEELSIMGDEIKLSYFNKVFFKRKSARYTKHNIDIKKVDNDIIEILNNGERIGVIRKRSMNSEDWGRVNTYFTSQPNYFAGK